MIFRTDKKLRRQILDKQSRRNKGWIKRKCRLTAVLTVVICLAVILFNLFVYKPSTDGHGVVLMWASIVLGCAGICFAALYNPQRMIDQYATNIFVPDNATLRISDDYIALQFKAKTGRVVQNKEKASGYKRYLYIARKEDIKSCDITNDVVHISGKVEERRYAYPEEDVFDVFDERLASVETYRSMEFLQCFGPEAQAQLEKLSEGSK